MKKMQPRPVRFHEGQIMIDGRPKLILGGEIHYFRLAKSQWRDRLWQLKADGLNTVSTYIPWLWHELPDGQVDLVGKTHPQRDLVSFLELVAEFGLNLVVKPGPFVMAELKNEGIPYRVYREYPQARPLTWDGAPVNTPTLDYLSPEFLTAVRDWYAQVMPLIAEWLAPRGGPIIAVQLCNEIGMLSWVSNSPDLTDVTLEAMRAWSRAKYGDEIAGQRVGADSRDQAAWALAIRSPVGGALPLHHDLGLYMRERSRLYVEKLRQLAEEFGVIGVPFLINVHGTGGGRATTFPIGLSQLGETCRAQAQMTLASDHYLGDLTVENVADFYLLVNSYMRAMLPKHQPLASAEFEAGTGNYGADLGQLYTPEAVELKTRLFLAQGGRLLSYYLLAGGENPHLEPSAHDGIDRIATTGQLHGVAAPIAPDGKPNATNAAIARVVSSVRGVSELLASSAEEHDDFAMGLVLNHYLTEHAYPKSLARRQMIANEAHFRGLGPDDILVRCLLLGGFSFPAVDLEAGSVPTNALVVTTGQTLGLAVQRRLVSYVRAGGKLLLVGWLPDQDDDGSPCTVLAEALGLKNAGRVQDLGGANPYWPTVRAHDWAAKHPEVRVTTAQLLARTDGRPLVPLLTEIGTELPCAVQLSLGQGEVIVLGCDYPADLDFYRHLMSALGVTPRWQHNAEGPGVVLTSTVSRDGQRLLHIINVAPSAMALTLRHHGRRVLSGRRLQLPARSGLILPMGVRIDGALIKESSAEILRMDGSNLIMRPTQKEDLVVLETDRSVHCDKGTVKSRGSQVRVLIPRDKHGDEPVKLRVR